jgi:hypothetical protein
MPNLSELRAIVRRDELLSSTDVISDANLNTLLNEGAVQFARDGQAYVLTATWNTEADTSEYVLSGATPKATGFLDLYWPTGAILYTQSSGVLKVLGRDFTIVSEQWLNRESPGWNTLESSDSLQYVYLGFNSSGYLVLGTVPAAETTTPSIKLWHLSSGTAMDGDTKYPFTNGTTQLAHIDTYLDGIAYWALHVLHRDKTKLIDESDRYLQHYNSRALQCREAQRKIFNAAVIGIRESDKVASIQTFGSL